MDELRAAIKVQLLYEQTVAEQPPGTVCYCAYCKQVKNNLDMHEWYDKRSSGKGEDVLYTLFNCVLVCRECHDRYGQTKTFTEAMLAHKQSLGYNLDSRTRD